MKTIFFDFGNVIGFFDHWRSVQPLEKYSPLSGPELFAVLYDGPLEDRFERGHITTADYVATAIRNGQLTCSPEQFLEHFRDIFTPNSEVCSIIPVLAKSYRLVLASNTNDAHYSHYVQQFKDVLGHFSALPTSHKAGARKPEAAFYEFCQQFAEAERSECLFVDDIAANIAAGQAFGWQTIHYRPGALDADLAAMGITLS
jgi:glucose-1-phosphatase